jgi:hypothetical protein
LLKQTVVYKNPFTNQNVSEEHYFHLSKSDLLEMQMENLNAAEITDPSTGEKLEGYRAMLQRVINDRNGTAIIQVVKDILRRSYGKKVGSQFVKSPEAWAEFASSGAYDQLFFDLCTNAKLQADFMNGVMPSEMLAEAQNAAEEAQRKATGANAEVAAVAQVAKDIEDPELRRDVEPRVITPAEAAEMDHDELQSGLATGRLRFGAPAQ